MPELQIMKLKVDNGFRQLIPPLTKEELHLLEQDLIHHGCSEPLPVWNSTVLDGYDRYEICLRLNLPYSVQRINLKNREEAIVWICINQLKRYNISEETQKYLIGKRYEIEKILGAHNLAALKRTKKEGGTKSFLEPPLNLTTSQVRERLAKEYNVSNATMLNYGHYSRALDSLSSVVPELPPKILSGEVKISQDNIVHLSKLTGPEITRLKQLVSSDISLLSSNAEIRRRFPLKQETPALLLPLCSVKDMPEYDPDAEISSLTLTIPSWVSSINRVRAATNIKNTTRQAREKLKDELIGLRETIDSILSIIKEVP